MGGTIGRVMRYAPQLGQTSPGGNVYDPWTLAGKEALGLDFHKISIPDRFRASLWSSKDSLRNAEKIFTAPIQRTGNVMTDQQMAEAYQHAEAVRQYVFGQLREKIAAAQNSGMSTSEIKSALKERQYSSSLIHDLLTGHYHGYKPGKNIMEVAKKNGNHVPHSLFSSQSKDYNEETEGE